jgi:hypothetical protein
MTVMLYHSTPASYVSGWLSYAAMPAAAERSASAACAVPGSRFFFYVPASLFFLRKLKHDFFNAMTQFTTSLISRVLEQQRNQKVLYWQ